MGFTFSTDVLNAVWNRLRADAVMSEALKGGTLFPFNAQGILTRMEVMPAMCPIFGMAAAQGGHHWPPSKRVRGPMPGIERRTSFLIEMATAGEDQRKILDLSEAFQDFMHRQFEKDNFGLGATWSEAEYANMSYSPWLSLKKHIEFWQFTGTMICKFRIS